MCRLAKAASALPAKTPDAIKRRYSALEVQKTKERLLQHEPAGQPSYALLQNAHSQHMTFTYGCIANSAGTGVLTVGICSAVRCAEHRDQQSAAASLLRVNRTNATGSLRYSLRYCHQAAEAGARCWIYRTPAAATEHFKHVGEQQPRCTSSSHDQDSCRATACRTAESGLFTTACMPAVSCQGHIDHRTCGRFSSLIWCCRHAAGANEGGDEARRWRRQCRRGAAQGRALDGGGAPAVCRGAAGVRQGRLALHQPELRAYAHADAGEPPSERMLIGDTECTSM